jgi:hypothetical protein
MGGGAGHRTLAEQLRAWPEDRVTRLLIARPDLATPAPQDTGQLAARAATRSSILRALDQLSLLELACLDGLSVAGHLPAGARLDLVHAAPDAARAAVERLVDLALAWESTDGIRPLSGAPEALGKLASGVRPLIGDPSLADRLDEVSEAARALLEHVDSYGGEATAGTARRSVTPDEAATPAEELLARGLLVPSTGSLVQVPGVVGVALRGGHTTTEPVDVVPALATVERDPALVARTAAGAAYETLTRLEVLLDHWGAQPPLELRSGGLAVRDLKATATLLHLEPAATALLVEVAAAAGLCATRADADGRGVFVPTDRFDTWRNDPAPDRWTLIARAWLLTPRLPSLAGTRDSANKTRNALDPESSSVWAVETRAMALEQLADLPADAALAAGTGVPSLVERLGWLRPRRASTRADQVLWALAEAAQLGVTGLDALPAHGRALLAGEDPAPLLADLLPAPVDHLLIQADLTAVAPGPLEASLARTMHAVADVESRGGASVYRFTSDSVRRALDAGWSAAELHAFLATASRTPVPQPLTYLIDDTARRFGSIRIGHAEAFLRADDEAALAEVLHHPKAASLGLRRLAPTVLISSTPLDVLLPRLRELGAAPVVEAIDGSVIVSRPDQLRARTPRTAPDSASARQEVSQARAALVTRAIRTGDEAAAARPPGRAGSLAPADALVALRGAVDAGQAVVIGYVDHHGTRSDRLVRPRRIESGQLVALDLRADDTRTFPIHRITTVTVVETRS